MLTCIKTLHCSWGYSQLGKKGFKLPMRIFLNIDYQVFNIRSTRFEVSMTIQSTRKISSLKVSLIQNLY